MNFLAAAKSLAAVGFHIFPLIPGSKLPAIDGFPDRATRDTDQIEAWWTCPVMGWEQPYNIGISTTHYGDGESLVVIDVDNKNDRRGDETLLALDIAGNDLPGTMEQRTPSGGRHLFYRSDHPCKQGVGVLGSGLDIRSKGGFVVGPGSDVALGTYEISVPGAVARAPQWLIERCGRAVRRDALPGLLLDCVHGGGQQIDPGRAQRRAIDYLDQEAPTADEGDGGDDTAYRVACRLKDMGVVEQDCLPLLIDHWNDRCAPPWDADELAVKVANAYRYGQEPVGSSAPEAQFDPVASDTLAAEHTTELGLDLHPFELMNKNHAFVAAGDGYFILHQDQNLDGQPRMRHWGLDMFHLYHRAKRMTTADGKTIQVSNGWLSSDVRRNYRDICFRPGRSVPPDVLNLWQGFAVEPLAVGEKPSAEAQASLDAFLEHATMNVSGGNVEQARWLIGWFAHLVQRPWEKPQTALVFRGDKGVGKNALLERVGALLGDNFWLASKLRYLMGNFNSHMERLLLFGLDEAFWSGDKTAEGTLKDLVTGAWHLIERKGSEPYRVENCLRVVIIGNEDWLVPASHDERRFAVYNVGDGRKQDDAFFQAMREGMERGGYRLLLRYLLDYDLSGINVNKAPMTKGLLDQKLASLGPFHQWWHDCLVENTLIGGDFDGWPGQIEKVRFRAAFSRYCRERNIHAKGDSAIAIGKLLHKVLPSIAPDQRHRRTKEEGGQMVNIYTIPPIEQARQEFSKYVGHPVPWA